jgi:glycosyltransferase involved in cell wall biosynthesis
MNKPKVAFVIQRYGIEVNGGAEEYCRMLAEKMIYRWDLEVLTSCAMDYYYRFDNEYPVGIESVNGVVVRRFKIDYFRSDEKCFGEIDIKVRKREASLEEELIWLKEIGPFSSSLINYVLKNHNEYDFFLFFTYLYATTTLVLPLIKEKSFLIPTAHDEAPIYAKFYDKFFAMPEGNIFSTPEEYSFIKKRTRGYVAPSCIIGIGLDPPSHIDTGLFRDEFRISSDFIVYVGRIQQEKGCHQLFDYYLSLPQALKDKYPLVLIGKNVLNIPRSDHIKHVGFLSNELKYSAISSAKIMIMPSYHESFSIVILESWHCNRPVLVNGNCDILREQCRRSNGGLWYYNCEEFKACLNFLLSNDVSADKMASAGKSYLKKNYSWDVIQNKFSHFLDQRIHN